MAARNSRRPSSGRPSPARRSAGRRRGLTVSGIRDKPTAAAASTPRYTTNTKVVACGAYWANSPATSGPRPRPPMFAAVAASDARRSPGLSSVSAAVAVPVTRPADSPDRTRPTASTLHVGGQDEHDRAQRTGAEGHGQHRLAPGLIRGPARQQQGGQDAGRVHRVDHRHDGGGEMPLILVDDVQRGGQRGAEHGGAEHEGHQPERDPAVGGPPSGLGGRRRGRQSLTAGVRTGVVHVSSSSSSPVAPPAGPFFAPAELWSAGHAQAVWNRCPIRKPAAAAPSPIATIFSPFFRQSPTRVTEE